MFRWVRTGAWLAVVGLGLLAVVVLSARPLVGWLATGEAPVASDLIVVVAGGAQERILTASDLYRKGFAPRILLTDPTGFPDREIRQLTSIGIPQESLIPPLRPAHSTYEDALTIREVCRRNGFRSILAVTSPYHCRRLRLTLERTLADLGIRVSVTASESLYFPLGEWWKYPEGRRIVSTEFLKLAWAWARVPVAAPEAAAGAGNQGR